MKKKPVKKEEKKQSKINVLPLILVLALLIPVILGGIFLGKWFIENSTTNKEDDESAQTVEAVETANRLLELLNDNINKTKIGSETLANEVTAFSYVEKHFYISGYNGSTMYQYNLDLSSTTLNTTKEAVDFLKRNEIEGNYDITLNRCTPTESEEFTTKYITEGVTGKYHVASFGIKKYAFATLLNNETITVINGDTLSDTLANEYKPLTIKSSDPLYRVYKLIVNK